MSPEDYVKQELLAGRLTYHHIAVLTEYFQEGERLTADGKPGPDTRKALEKWGMPPAPALVVNANGQTVPFLACPLPALRTPDGGPRHAVVTSGFHTVNPDRPNHNGCDWFYPWQPGDKPDFVGNGGGATLVNGHPKWVVPFGTYAIAAADGVIQVAGNSETGYRAWIDHGNGWRTGYFHLTDLAVHVGEKVVKGAAIGPVGDNPKDTDARHLHFELSPVDRYAPVNPEPYVIKP